ncbi:hypothetical protein K502DRAFT_328087 [Neoconidiobolus thromboides FSU 785]|nr:hypothetical protein K502DRAFT_328087 [Neoconidiobolus thromboides FSU 785]
MSNYPLVFQQGSINDSVKSKLIEIDPEISKDFEDLLDISKKSNLSFKGEPSEEVVLCSADKTYLIKQAPTSDSLLITEIKNKDYNVSKILNNTHIMELIPGRLLKAYQLIERSSYNGVHNEHKIDPLKLLSLEQIKYSVQASDKEIEEYLKELNAIDLDGKIRLVNSDYLYDLLDMLLSYTSSLGLNNSQFEKQVIFDFIDNQGIDPIVFRHCFYCFTSVNPDGKYSLNKVKIARFGPISIYDFLQTWNEKLSEFELNMDLLNVINQY